MIVLVDYDNIPKLERNRGLPYVVSRIVDTIGLNLSGEAELRFRLYGGWFQGPRLTRRAQYLVPELRAAFPRAVTAPPGATPQRLIARAELAFDLAAAPGRYLTHTYREKAVPKNVECSSLPYDGCRKPGSCPIAPMHALLRDSQCPESWCEVGIGSVLSRPEQKLVDTMLTVDILHMARATAEKIAVVSTDDDIWPGIQVALLYGARIVHVHTEPGRTTPAHYAALAAGHYVQVGF